MGNTSPYWVRPIRTDPRPLPNGSITGTVAAAGVALKDVRLTLTGPLTGVTRTDSQGRFAFTYLPAENYTVVAGTDSHAFTPGQQQLTLTTGQTRAADFNGSLINNLGWRKVKLNLPSPYYRAVYAISNEVWLASNNRIYHSPDLSTQPLRLVFQGQTQLNGMTGFVTNGLRYLWAVGGASMGARTTSPTGTNWTDMWLSGDNNFTCVSFVNPQLGFAAGLDWQLHRTTDGGSNWNDTGNRISVGAINALLFLNATNGFAATASPSFRETLDGGMTWPRSTPGSFRDVFALDSEHVWAAGPDGVLVSHIRTGGFMTFQRVTSPHDYSLSQVAFVNTSEGWLGSIHGHLLHSFDGGRSWPEDLHLTDDWIRDLFFSSPTNGWAITGDSLFHYGPLYETAATEAPLLVIGVSGTNVVLSWPASVTGYTLTTTPQLETGAVWTVVTNPVSVIGSNRVVTNAAAGASRFYRLTDQP